jgi:GDPmannose 4,6-dehydratase
VRALIIGSAGQDGRILWDQLREQGHDVVGVARDRVHTQRDSSRPSVDIGCDRAVLQLVEDFAPDRIFFLAAHHHSSEDRTGGDGELWKLSLRTHVDAFRNVLEAVRVAGLPARIFYASSSRVFGSPDCSPQTEETPLKPGCIYGITKATGMMLARYYRDKHAVFASCGILYNHESPLRGPQFLSQKVARGLVAVKEGRQSHLEIGSLDSRVDWGYAPDYTRAMQLMLEAPDPGDFIVATGRTHSVREMVEVAADVLGLPWRTAVVENPSLLQRPTLPLCGDASRLRAVTGWTPTRSFDEMVRLMTNAASQSSCSSECAV